MTTSRSFALIDGTSRRNFYESSGNDNLGYWDDPSYYRTPQVLKSNTPAYIDRVVDEKLIEPRNYGTPFLSHDEITRIVSKQFADDIKERARASGQIGSSSLILVLFASSLAAAGIFDVLLLAQPNPNPFSQPNSVFTDGCFSKPEDKKPEYYLIVSAGIWASILPVLLGLQLGCSKQSSNADYIHTFDPVLRIDGRSGQAKKTNRLYLILVVVSLIVLILGFACGIADIALFAHCSQRYVAKLVVPIIVCILCVIVFILVIYYLIGSKKLGATNSNYDRRDYDITLEHGRYNASTYDGGKRPIQMFDNLGVTSLLPVPSQIQQADPPLVTFDPAIPAIPPPPLGPSQPVMPTGPSIFAGSQLPVRALPYQTPMYYQMPTFTN